MRWLARLLVVPSLAAACSSFGSSPSPGPADAEAPPVEAGPLREAGEVGDDDAAVAPIPSPGEGCAKRRERYQQCRDYEDGVAAMNVGNGDLAVRAPGSSSGMALVGTVDAPAYAAFNRERVDCSAKRVAWVFDLFLDVHVVNGTNLTELLIEGNPTTTAAIQVSRRGEELVVTELDRGRPAAEREAQLAKIALPSNDQWVTVGVEVDFERGTSLTHLRTPDGSTTSRPGTVRRKRLESDCWLEVGLYYVETQTTAIVKTDNVAWRSD